MPPARTRSTPLPFIAWPRLKSESGMWSDQRWAGLLLPEGLRTLIFLSPERYALVCFRAPGVLMDVSGVTALRSRLADWLEPLEGNVRAGESIIDGIYVENVRGYASYAAIDIHSYAGHPTTALPLTTRHQLLSQLFNELDRSGILPEDMWVSELSTGGEKDRLQAGSTKGWWRSLRRLDLPYQREDGWRPVDVIPEGWGRVGMNGLQIPSRIG